MDIGGDILKQEIISFLNTCKDELKNLNKYIYNNPEESYKEFNCSKYIIDLLKSHGFSVEENLCDSETSFMATKGNGHPKICYLCEYDAIKEEGHLTGHNLVTTMSVGAALGLGKIIEKCKGTVIIIGCAGEYHGGSKCLFTHQGIFKDIDAVFEAHPDLHTSESGTSSAIVPLKINFKGHGGFSFLKRDSYTSLDAILLTFNIINSITKGLPNNVEINQALSKGGHTPLLIPLESEALIYIRASNIKVAKMVDSKIKNIIKFVSNLLDINYTVSLYEPPNDELITNRTLNRLFSHNLKENGIIDTTGPKDVNSGLSIGCVSHKVPTIHPYINICESDNILYGSSTFSKATITDYAFERAFNTSISLATTGLDIIQKENLLADIKSEFYKDNPSE